MLKQGPDFHFETSGYSRSVKLRQRESNVLTCPVETDGPLDFLGSGGGCTKGGCDELCLVTPVAGKNPAGKLV